MTPRRFAVIGDPVSHSRSPAMHSAAYRALGLPHGYEAVRVTADELPGVVGALRDGSFDGLNITVPHKERVLSIVDSLDASAQAVLAANTLVRSADRRVVAHNTDAPALAAELSRLSGATTLWGEGRGLVLGSGGAARAAIAAFAALGVGRVVVRARAFTDASRRAHFVGALGLPMDLQPLEASRRDEEGTVAVVQATSAGMQGADPGDAVADAVAWKALPDTAVAIDVVYAPRATPFLRAAHARGLRCDDGLGMLARQGALAFELWLGLRAPLDVMRTTLEQ